MIKGVCAAAAAVVLLSAGPGFAMNNEDVAGALGMLWRVTEGVCPAMRLDPDRFGSLIKPAGMTAAQIRRTYAEAFDQGYAVAGEWMAEGGAREYCKSVRGLFDGKSDFFGNAKATPTSPAPGLTFLD